MKEAPGKASANFSDPFDSQIAGVAYAEGRRENSLWDSLALIHRNGTKLLNEHTITGGTPVLSEDFVHVIYIYRQEMECRQQTSL